MDAPNFQSIAEEIALLAREAAPEQLGGAAYTNLLNGIADRFRRVWNARGAADIAKLEADLSQQMGATSAGPYIKNLDRALRSLDR